MTIATNYYTRSFVRTGAAAACALTKIDEIARPVGETVIANAIAVSQALATRTINNGIECREAFDAWGGTQRIVLEALRLNAKYEMDAKVMMALRVTFVFLAGVVGFAWGFIQGIPGWIDMMVEQSQEQQVEESEDIEIGTAQPLPICPEIPICPESGETSDVLLMVAEESRYQQMTSHELRKECKAAGIQWRNAHGEGKHLQKPEMVELLNAREGAIA